MSYFNIAKKLTMSAAIFFSCILLTFAGPLDEDDFDGGFGDNFGIRTISNSLNADAFDVLEGGAFRDIWGSMYSKHAHDGPGGFYGPGGQFEQEWTMFVAACMCDGMQYLAAENSIYRDFVNQNLENAQKSNGTPGKCEFSVGAALSGASDSSSRTGLNYQDGEAGYALGCVVANLMGVGICGEFYRINPNPGQSQSDQFCTHDKK